MIKISYEKFKQDVKALSQQIDSSLYKNIYAIPRGGVCVALELTKYLDLPLTDTVIPYKTLIVDDLIDSGETLREYKAYNACAVLYRKPTSPEAAFHVEELDGWIEFFYEQTKKDLRKNLIRTIEFLQGMLKECA